MYELQQTVEADKILLGPRQVDVTKSLIYAGLGPGIHSIILVIMVIFLSFLSYIFILYPSYPVRRVFTSSGTWLGNLGGVSGAGTNIGYSSFIYIY